MRNCREVEPGPLAPSGGDPAGNETLPWRDPERLGALLLSLEPRLRAVALRYTHDADAAEDVLQNAFEKVIRHGGQFRGGSLPSTWMYRIVANEALMWLRSEKRRARRVTPTEDLERLPVVDPAPNAAERLTRRDDVMRVRRAIASLSAEERQVVERCGLEGRSYRHFSEEFGVHPGAAKSRAFRARRRLGQLLGPRDAQPLPRRKMSRDAREG